MSEPVRVLLVDDQVRNLEALEAVLATSGCGLLCAQSADEALLLLLEHDFAAIVLDIMMPGMNGIDLARLIKSRKRSRHIPILFLTAHLLEERDVLRGYEVGAVDYLTKPLNPEILRSKVAVFVDLYRKSQALVIANDALQREIAERQRAEEALRVANQDLEYRVETRTAEVIHAHRELRASEERLRLALDAGRMGTWETDEAAKVTRLDDVQGALLGLDAAARNITVEALYSLIHDDDRYRVRHAIERARRAPDPADRSFEVEFRVIRPRDGELRWLLARGKSVPDSPERPARTVGVSFDITHRKRAEEALMEADRRKNDFLATLAHELRNPLAPIRNAIQILLLKGTPDPELVAARQVIARQTTHLTRLVDDLLDISRITQDKLELRKEPTDLARVVQAAVETSQPLIESGRHQLNISLPDEPIVIDADLTRLGQVISNLLNNAAKYSEPNGTISLTAERRGRDAVVVVRDTGAGIPSAMLPHIFQMFVQAERPNDRSGGGLGVGLALSRRLVELHGGSIGVASAGPGKGSEFEIRLPVSVDSEAETAAAAINEGETDNLTAALRVLVVDDYRDATESLTTLLRIVGADTRAAHDGPEAVDVAREFQPDVVLLDIGLPGMSGYQVARRIREESGDRPVALIALTGWGQEADRRASREAGFDHHLVKPVAPHELMKLLAGLNAGQAVVAGVISARLAP